MYSTCTVQTDHHCSHQLSDCILEVSLDTGLSDTPARYPDHLAFVLIYTDCVETKHCNMQEEGTVPASVDKENAQRP